MLPFRRFSASFSLKCDVADVILQGNEEMKVQYLRSLLFDLLKLSRLLELSKEISFHFKFCRHGNQSHLSIIEKPKGLLFKQKCFLKNNFETIQFNCHCK